MLEIIQKNLKRFNVKITDATLSLVLGLCVVVVSAFIAYTYFNQDSKKTANEPSNQPENKISQLTPATSTQALPVTHIVQPGETLWSIAEKYYFSGDNWTDISEANPTVSPSLIFSGTKLTIPKVSALIPTPKDETPKLIFRDKIEGTNYTVQIGDNLWNIALRAYGDPYRWVDISKANNLVNPDLIHSGNFFTIPR